MNEQLLDTNEPKPKSDKLLWIVGIVTILLVVAFAMVYVVTRKNTIGQKTTTATSFTDCPDKNKQHPGHCISSNIDQLKLQPNATSKYQFAILNANNKPIKTFETVHEKQMHVIVVRKDLAYFQHIHPTLDTETGIWTLDKLTIPTDGPYRLFADFTEGGAKSPVTVYEDLSAGDLAKYKAEAIGDTKEDKTFGTNQIILQTEPVVIQANTEAKLIYLFGDTQKGGTAVSNLEPYLGAMGHAVILSENLDFIHAHAMDDKVLASRGVVEFMATLPKEGKYKVFGQFQREGKVFTTDFVLPVYSNLAPADQRINSGNDVHSGH